MGYEGWDDGLMIDCAGFVGLDFWCLFRIHKALLLSMKKGEI
jgi:transcriptional antiterminator Rof (Rho-off)